MSVSIALTQLYYRMVTQQHSLARPSLTLRPGIKISKENVNPYVSVSYNFIPSPMAGTLPYKMTINPSK